MSGDWGLGAGAPDGAVGTGDWATVDSGKGTADLLTAL